MHYGETMQLIEAFKQNPVQGTLIVLVIALLIWYLIYLDKRKNRVELV